MLNNKRNHSLHTIKVDVAYLTLSLIISKEVILFNEAARNKSTLLKGWACNMSHQDCRHCLHNVFPVGVCQFFTTEILVCFLAKFWNRKWFGETGHLEQIM